MRPLHKNQNITRNKDLALDMVRVTELAAINASFFVGRGDKEGGDKAAVDAMRYYLNTVNIAGTIIIGEGEKDNAPMLYNGEKVGTGKGLAVDIAVDPVEGTTLMANGEPNSITTIALADAGSMLEVGSSFYMNKIVVPHEASQEIDITAPTTTNLKNIATALNRDIKSITVFVLNRPRNRQLIKDIRSVGARILLHEHGDVSGALSAVLPDTPIDVMMGIGGTPEAIIAAAAVKATGGGMQCQYAPQSAAEALKVVKESGNTDKVLQLNDLIRSDNTFFAATGLTDGAFLRGVQFKSSSIVTTHSIVMRSSSGTIRYIDGIHNLNKKLKKSEFNIVG